MNFSTQTQKQLQITLALFMAKVKKMVQADYRHLVSSAEEQEIYNLFKQSLKPDSPYMLSTLSDMAFIYERDPALRQKEEREVVIYKTLPLFFLHRLSHTLYQENKTAVARFLSEINRQINQAEIHPGARVGEQIFIDHPTGLIIGETTIIGNRFQSFGQVLLGNDGKNMGPRRHPSIGDDVTIYPKATVSGPIRVGNNTIIGAGACITEDVPPHATVLGLNHLSKIGSHKKNMSLKTFWDKINTRG